MDTENIQDCHEIEDAFDDPGLKKLEEEFRADFARIMLNRSLVAVKQELYCLDEKRKFIQRKINAQIEQIREVNEQRPKSCQLKTSKDPLIKKLDAEVETIRGQMQKAFLEHANLTAEKFDTLERFKQKLQENPAFETEVNQISAFQEVWKKRIENENK